MKLVRFGVLGQEKPAIVDSRDRIRDLSGHIEDVAQDALSTGSANNSSGWWLPPCRRHNE